MTDDLIELFNQAFQQNRVQQGEALSPLGTIGGSVTVQLGATYKRAKCATDINSSQVLVMIDNNGQAWAFCATSPQLVQQRTNEFVKSVPQPKTTTGNVKILVIVQPSLGLTQFYIGGDRPNLELVRSITSPTTLLFDARMNNLGLGRGQWQFEVTYSYGSGSGTVAVIECVRPSNPWILTIADDYRVNALTGNPPAGRGFFQKDDAGYVFGNPATASLAAYESTIYQAGNSDTFVLPPDITRPKPAGAISSPSDRVFTQLIFINNSLTLSIYRTQTLDRLPNVTRYFLMSATDTIEFTDITILEGFYNDTRIQSISFYGTRLYVPTVLSSFAGTTDGKVRFDIYEVGGGILTQQGSIVETVKGLNIQGYSNPGVYVSYFPPN